MKTYRVTYVEGLLREAVVEAQTPEHAEEITLQQMQNAEHHHCGDAWSDDFQVEEYKGPPIVNRFCIECGERR